MNRILLVEDHDRLAKLICTGLAKAGIAADVACQLDAAWVAIREVPYGALILDRGLPDGDGLTLLRRLRSGAMGIPCLLLTARDALGDRIEGLEAGADDYLPKPFELRELLARVRAVLRRLPAEQAPAAAGSPPAPAAAPVADRHRVAFGACSLDLDRRRLFDGQGVEIPITAAEFDLLALFARHPNRPLNRDQIMEQAHHRGWDVYDRSIDLRVMRLRRKIERNPDKPEVIRTVRSVGYVYVPPDAAAGGAR